MDWPELLEHPLWTQVLKEEDDVAGEEEDRERHCEEITSLRCVDCYNFFAAPSEIERYFVKAILLYKAFCEGKFRSRSV